MEHGVASTVRYYANKFPGLKASSVRMLRNTYKSKLKKRVRYTEDDITISEFPEKKRGRLLLLGEELERQVKTYLVNMVNTAIIIACAEGILISKDSNLLAKNDCHIPLSLKAGSRVSRSGWGYS